MAATARIDAVKTALRAAVAGTTPLVFPERGFISVLDRTKGRRDRLEDVQDGLRWFEIVAGSLPYGEPGACRDLVTFIVRIRYDRTGDRDPLETMILEDCRALACELRKAANWNQTASGLTGVEPGEPLIENFPDDDAPEFSIVGIPLFTRIRSC